jgi:hypothetical protein
MKKKKSENVIRLPIKNPSVARNNPSQVEDSWNPLRAAHFCSEISKSIGPYRTPAQVYKAMMEFDLTKSLEQETAKD